MLAEALADSWAEASLCDRSLNEFIEAEALAETTLRLSTALATAEADALVETNRALRLATEAEISALWLVVEADASLRLVKDVEYSDNESADKDPADSLSQLLRSLRLWSAVDRDALAVDKLSTALVTALAEALATDAEVVCESRVLVEADAELEASLASTDAVLSLATDHCDCSWLSLIDC